MDFELKRPLVFFDLETTGTVVGKDRIVEMAFIKMLPNGSKQAAEKRINPQMPIPPEATAIHHISDADVAGAPTFGDVAARLFAFLEDCDFAGYNLVKFDLPMLQSEFRRVGLSFTYTERKVIDVFNIFCKLYPRTLSAAYKHFCGSEMEDAHSAMADTAATIEILSGQLKMHPELPATFEELAQYSDMRDPDMIDGTGRFKFRGSEAVVNFGKNNGRSLRDIATNDPSFLSWIIRSEFPDDVKAIAKDALIGKFPVREAAGSN